MIISKKYSFQNIRIKLNSITWMTEVLISENYRPNNLCNLIDLIGLYNFKSPISPKNFIILMVGSSFALK